MGWRKGMQDLQPEKLHVTFEDEIGAQNSVLPRRYTLTHSDRTGDLFLSIGRDYNRRQISGLYTRLMRDEVLAELNGDARAAALHVYCHVSGGLVIGTAHWRNGILHHHMRQVIEAFRYGDREFYARHPEGKQAKVWVHFHSSDPKYNQVEDWENLTLYE
jgi:hypothetical protein